MAIITHTDYLITGGVPGLWVRLRNNSTGTDYYATAITDALGAYTHSAPPGDYSLYWGTAATVPGTPNLRNAHYAVPVTAGDDIAAGSVTSTISTYTPPAGAGAGMILAKVSPHADVRAWGALCDAKGPGDGAITTGTPTLTSATAAFTAADVGKLMWVWGAGAAGVDHKTTIAAYVNATTVTLAANAGTTVSGAQFFYGTDDTTAIQNALNSFGLNNYNWQGGIVKQTGLSCITARLIVPTRVAYEGIGRNVSGVVAMGAFPVSTELVRLGDIASGSISFGNRCENMSIYCNGIAGSIGGYSERINEESGFIKVSVFDFVQFGIEIGQPASGQTPQNYTLNKLELIAGHNATAATQCLQITHGAAGQLDPWDVSEITALTTGAAMTVALQLDGVGCKFKNIHVEKAVTAILVGSVRTCTGIQFDTCNFGPTVTNCITFSNATAYNSYSVSGLTAAGTGFTNSIVDQHEGLTLTEAVAWYSVGGGSAGAENLWSTVSTVSNRFLGLLYAIGAAAAIGFADRTGGFTWQWYGTSSIARLFNGSADVQKIDATGRYTAYGNTGLATAGLGVPAIYQAPAPLTGQTAAVASVAAITSPNDGVKHTYMVSGFVTITTLGSGSFNLQVSYTDSNGTARTCNIPLAAQAGTFGALANTADDYKGTVEITVNPNTAVTIKTAGTFTGCTYNVGGNLKQVL